MISYPFPHFVIRNFLPDHTFRAIYDSYPGDDIFLDAKSSSKSRKIVEETDDKFQQILDANQNLRHLFDATQGKAFQEIILKKYLNHIKKLGGDLSTAVISPQMDITRATAGYTRSVHLDRTHHIVSSMLYLNSTKDIGGEGGDLCLHDIKRNTNVFDVFPKNEDCPIVKKIKTERNLYICWLGCHLGYHSIVPLTKTNGYRKSIYIAINDDINSVWKNQNIKVLSEERRQQFINE